MDGDMRFTASCLAAIACLVSAGCVGTRPVHYYTLGSAEPHAGQEQTGGPAIVVANIATSETLQDDRIRYRVGANEVGTYEFHHWTERPSVLIRDGLMEALRSSGKYARVLEASSSAAGDYTLRGRLYEFEEVDNPAIQTKISLQLDLVDKKTNHIVWDHLFERDEPATGKSMNDVVASMDRNLSQVASQAAGEIDRFIAARH